MDVRSKTRTYQKPYPTSFDSVAYPAGFRLREFDKFSGKGIRSTFDHISQYLAILEEAGSINELKVHFFFFILNWNHFLMVFSSLVPNFIGSWE